MPGLKNDKWSGWGYVCPICGVVARVRTQRGGYRCHECDSIIVRRTTSGLVRNPGYTTTGEKDGKKVSRKHVF